MAFRENASRTVVEHAGANLSLVRWAASLVKRDPGQGTVTAKRLTAA